MGGGGSVFKYMTFVVPMLLLLLLPSNRGHIKVLYQNICFIFRGHVSALFI